MTDVNGPEPLPDHVFALLDRAMRGLREELPSWFSALPDEQRASDLEALRPSQARLLELTPAAGMRVTDLAARVGMTAQALGEFVKELVARGYLVVEPDPADRRVRVVRRTVRGEAAADASTAAIGAMEADWRARLGPRRWDALRAGLRALGDGGGVTGDR